jgi:hypothetical protein
MICALGQSEPKLQELKRAVDQLQAALRNAQKALPREAA